MPLDLPPLKNAKPEPVDGEELDEVEIPFKPDYLYTTSEEVINILKSGDRILGSPGASLTWGIDGDRMKPQLDSGMEGEKQTADILAQMIEKVPQMFVYHSLSWPESNGDTDHIVVYGNLVIVIDSKRWKATRKYSITDKGGILRGTVSFPEGKVKIGYALASWRKKLPAGMKVQGVVCIASEKVFVTRDQNWYKAPFRLVEAENLETFLLNTFKKNPITGPVSSSTLIYLGKLLVKARDRRSELIRVGGERRSLT
jgi:hypothetical protein